MSGDFYGGIFDFNHDGKGERNTERWRNPDVTLNEIIEANNQQ